MAVRSFLMAQSIAIDAVWKNQSLPKHKNQSPPEPQAANQPVTSLPPTRVNRHPTWIPYSLKLHFGFCLQAFQNPLCELASALSGFWKTKCMFGDRLYRCSRHLKSHANSNNHKSPIIRQPRRVLVVLRVPAFNLFIQQNNRVSEPCCVRSTKYGQTPHPKSKCTAFVWHADYRVPTC